MRRLCFRQILHALADPATFQMAYRCFLPLTVTGAVFLAACEGYVSPEAARNVERIHRVAFVPGYSGFRLLDSSADVGVAIFSYQVPDDLAPAQALETAQAQIRQSDGCFQATRPSALEIQLRCPNRTGGGFTEYRLTSMAGGVTVMYGDFDSPEEVAAYSEFARAFLRAAQRAE
jgi:hypothetical protein